jgi:hypothetical protein
MNDRRVRGQDGPSRTAGGSNHADDGAQQEPANPNFASQGRTVGDIQAQPWSFPSALEEQDSVDAQEEHNPVSPHDRMTDGEFAASLQYLSDSELDAHLAERMSATNLRDSNEAEEADVSNLSDAENARLAERLAAHLDNYNVGDEIDMSGFIAAERMTAYNRGNQRTPSPERHPSQRHHSSFDYAPEEGTSDELENADVMADEQFAAYLSNEERLAATGRRNQRSPSPERHSRSSSYVDEYPVSYEQGDVMTDGEFLASLQHLTDEEVDAQLAHCLEVRTRNAGHRSRDDARGGQDRRR